MWIVPTEALEISRIVMHRSLSFSLEIAVLRGILDNETTKKQRKSVLKEEKRIAL